MYVSCAHGDIYRNGSWFDDASLLNEFSHGGAVRLGPEIVCELFPPYSYQRQPPAIIGSSATAAYAVRRISADVDAQFCCGSGSVLVRAQSACISRTVVYLMDQGQPRAVYETHRPNERSLLPLRGDAELTQVDRRFEADARKVYLWIGSAGSGNYGHWLVDDLLRMKAIAELRARRPRADIVLVTPRAGRLHEQVHIDTCAMICGAGRLGSIEVIFAEPEERLYFEEVFFATPVSNHPMSKSPQALRYVSEMASVTPLTAEDQRTLPKRIFLRRAASGHRNLVNQPEVETYLAKYGFVSLDTGEMPFMLQAGLFRNAAMVIGCMGAAMTNTMFSPPGAAIGYLAPSGWVEPFYWDLAAARGHRYAACYGMRFSLGEKPWEANYRIEMGDLDRLLRTLEGQDQDQEAVKAFA